jgi:hypothetical protein
MDGLGTLIGGLTGVLGSMAPTIIETWEKNQARAHEIQMRKMEVELASQGHVFALAQKQVDADIAEINKLYEHDMALKGGWLIDAIRASVRPTITYVFFGVYLFIKMSALYQAWATGVPVTVAVPTLWSGDDQAIFAAVISFWFGHRAMARFSPSGKMQTAFRSLATPVRVLDALPLKAKKK